MSESVFIHSRKLLFLRVVGYHQDVGKVFFSFHPIRKVTFPRLMIHLTKKTRGVY